LDSLHIWFCENGMALNASKSVVILFGTSQRLKSLSGLKSVDVAGTVIPVSDKVKILGATLDSNLTMEPHTKTLFSSCFYHIRSLKQIRSSLNDICRRYCCLTSLFSIVDTCLSCEDMAPQNCAMMHRWRILGDFFASCISSEPFTAHFRPAF